MIINLTPHAIHLPTVTIEPSGTVARCQEITVQAGTFEGTALVRKEYGQVTDLPAPEDGVLYIVSMMVRLALPDRTDLASPGDLVRDASGQIVGAKNLAVN
jgi:hypothetical protein